MSDKVRQFELKVGCGPHIDRNDEGERIKYEPGEVIHTTKDLNTAFPHKFRELGVSKKATMKKTVAETRAGRDRDHFEKSDEHPLKQKSQPVEDDEEVEEDAQHDEDDPETAAIKKKAKKVNKGEKVSIPQEDEDHIDDEDNGHEGDDEPDDTAVKSKFGKDVTGTFETAAKSDLKVFYTKKNGHTVVDADEPDKPLKAKLKTPKAVEKFLKDYRKG